MDRNEIEKYWAESSDDDMETSNDYQRNFYGLLGEIKWPGIETR